MTDFERQIETGETESEILRKGDVFGRKRPESLLNSKIDVNPDHLPDLDKYMNYPYTFRDIQNFAIILRDLVEWQIWSDRTAFPYVKSQAEPGEALGQCLVTSRLAKNYFIGAEIVEVKVKQKSGQIVGPHVVLKLPVSVREEGDARGIVDFYLDLTADQDLALGDVPPIIKASSPHKKVNLVEVDAEDCPYIFVRYQTDSDLEGKRSLPLQHSNLLLEMFAYRYRSETIQGLERYAKDLENDFENLPEPLSSRVAEASEYLNQSKKNLKNDVIFPTLQVGVISLENFSPSPDWLWEVSGLRGFSEALLIDHESPQTFYFFIKGEIIIVNLFGTFSEKILKKITDILSPENQHMRVLYAPSNLFAFQRRKGFTGPLMVK